MVKNIVWSDDVVTKTREVAMWVVELNIPGCRIRRRVDKRRHLIAPDPRSFLARELPVRTSPAA